MKLTELPRQCPDCQQPFSPLVKHERTLSWPAKVLLVIGIVGSFLVGCVLCFFVFLILPAGGVIVPIRGPIAIVIWTPIIAVVTLPGIVFGRWALMLPKCVRLLCFRCGWKQVFLVDNRG